MAFTLPALPYAFEALEPNIDATTMQIHHGKRHQAYVDNLNKAIAGTPNEGKTREELVQKAGSISPVVRNNGGGHWNHSFFWEILSPKSTGAPAGKLADDIHTTFGSFDAFKEKFNAAGISRDRKSTRLNSSHQIISYAVFCLKKKILTTTKIHYTHSLD